MDGVGGVVSNVQSLSSTQFSYQYGPIAGGSGNYGGAILVLGQDTNGSKDGVLESFYSLPGAGLVFKVEGTTALQKIRVSVSDNKVARVVDGKTQYRSVTLEFTVSAGTPYITISAADLVKAAADFDATKISSVTFIADENTVPKPAAGAKNTVTVTGSGFGYLPEAPHDIYDSNLLGALDRGDVVEGSTAAGTQGLIISTLGAGHENGSASVTQTSTGHFTWTFDLPNESETEIDPDTESDDLAIGEVAWGYFNASGTYIGTDSGQLPASLVIGANGTNGLTVKVEIYDTAGEKVQYLMPMTGDWQNYTLDLSSIDNSHIARILFVSDKDGTVQFHMKELKDVLAGPAVPPLAATDVSLLGGLLNLIAFNSKSPYPTGTAVVSQDSASRFNITYDVSVAGSYVGSVSSYDNFGTTTTLESHNLTADGVTDLTVGLRLDSGTGSIMLELQDVNGVQRAVTLTGVDGTERFYRVPLTSFAGIDLTKITNINVVIVNGKVSDSTAKLEVRFGNQPYTFGINPDPLLNASNISHLLDLRNLVGFSSAAPDPTATVTISPSSATRFNINYNVTPPGSYGGSISTFDDFGTDPKETVDLSGMTQFVLGVRLQSGSGAVQLAFEDIDGTQAKVYLNGLSDAEHFYKIVKSDLSNIKWAQVRNIVVLVEEAKVTEKIGVVEVRFGDNHWPSETFPVVTGTAYNFGDLTSFGTEYPRLVAGNGNSTTGAPLPPISLTQPSRNEFEYQYDLSQSSTGYTFVSVTNGAGSVFSLYSPQYVFAAMGSEGERVKVEVKDINGKKATFLVLLSSTFQNYTLDLTAGNGSVPADFDMYSIEEIVFVQDQNIGSPLLNDFVKIQTRDLGMVNTPLPANMAAIKAALVEDGLSYFKTTAGAGIDPVTHFPYDNITMGTAEKFTQPTLIGFYLQILGDIVRGVITDPGMSKSEALTEIGEVLTNLLSAQANYGWVAPGSTKHGLIPWLNLSPLGARETKVALGDNANLAQSIAVMMGALDLAGLTGAELTKANQIVTAAEQFLDNQADGYAAFVDSGTGRFHGDVNTQTGVFSNSIDRLANEFRGAVAFLAVRYASVVPSTVWNNLDIVTNDNYVDRNNQVIENLAAWDGGAFQIFWPSLRNNEMDFIGFRNALYNQLATQLDYAYQNRIPGIVSASQLPEGGYAGNLGIPLIAEENMDPNAINELLGDIGSSYALAAAMGVDRYAVLGWLDSINYLFGYLEARAEAGNTDYPYGFLDAARSRSEVANSYIGVDVASTILGLAGKGSEDFTAYLRKRSLEVAYNGLYDSASRKIDINKATGSLPNTPEFPDRSLAVFSNKDSEGTINHFSAAATETYGVRLSYTDLQGMAGGHFWKLKAPKSPYDAQSNQLILTYSALVSSQPVRIVLRNASGVVYQSAPVVLEQGTQFGRIVIDLPNQAALSSIEQIDLIVDPADAGVPATGDFTIHAINFQHVPSAENLTPTAGLGSGDVTSLPGTGTAQVASSPTGSVITNPGANLYQVGFDLRTVGAFTEMYANFDPDNNGSSVDLSAVPQLVFGVSSDKATMLKLEIEDKSGKRATYYLKNVDVAKNYYKFLTASASGKVDLTHIKGIHFSAVAGSVSSGNEIGSFQVEIGGLQYP